ncbi:hypothetical protein JCM30237_18670 [Halolamina litorea]|uniref:Energy-coupling factor transport system substrate-specific component n=1 Tax=Halolamina litorea TaxID=1515593 RepID=A0ABD6BS98_9EURY|nr:hypothetical protein [Halolamina litorea]
MRSNYVPSRAVLAGGAATVLWIGTVLAVHTAGSASIVEALNNVEDVSGWLMVGGVPGGFVTGAVADDYAPLLKEGFMASVGGAAALVTAIGCYGIALSISRGYGADSLLSFMFTGPTTFTFFLLTPLLAMEGVLGALVADAVRGRLRKRGVV